MTKRRHAALSYLHCPNNSHSASAASFILRGGRGDGERLPRGAFFVSAPARIAAQCFKQIGAPPTVERGQPITRTVSDVRRPGLVYRGTPQVPADYMRKEAGMVPLGGMPSTNTGEIHAPRRRDVRPRRWVCFSHDLG